MNGISSLTILLLCLFCYTECKLAPWTPIDWRTLPKANADDFIEVRYLVAPILEDTYGNLLKPIKAFHGAIAFNNLNQNFSITLNYDADDILHAALFPDIVQNSDGQTDLKWDNGGANFIYMGINDTYWDVYNEVVAIVDGTTYNEFISGWNANVNQTDLYYEMFGVLNHWGGAVYITGWTCFDYVFAAFQVLSQNGGQFDKSLTVVRDYINIYSSTPPVNVTLQYLTDSSIHQEIVEQYELIEDKASQMSILELILAILDLLDGSFYLRNGSDYWKLDLTLPFFAIDAVQVSLPNGKPVEFAKIIL